jgi:hypothetical protein
VEKQGGLSGYAHVAGDGLGTVPGLALEGAFDLIDFVEIAQNGVVGTRNWFDLLNLGLRIAPAAGTDYPYLDHPGAVRTYVYMPDGFSVDGWFAGLEAGRAYVTTGPFLNVAINSKGIGEEVRLAAGEPIRIEARAWMSPDIDQLDRIEIIEQGAVIAKSGGSSPGEPILLGHTAKASRSTWFVVRAVGRRSVPGAEIAAVSAPVYVVVDGHERTWKRDEVPRIVERLTQSLDQLQSSTLSAVPENENWEAGPGWMKVFADQLTALSERIAAARERLEHLAEQAGEN